MIRKGLACVAVGFFCIATASSVRAADPSDWAGFYVGGTIGVPSTTFSGPVTFPSFTTSSGALIPGATVTLDTGRHTSASGGGQVGYLWVLRGLVAGVEGQVAGAMASGTVTLGSTAVFPFLASDTFTARSSWTTTMRARVGLVHEQWLMYGTAGAALTSVTVSGMFPEESALLPVVSGSDRHTLKGGTVGLGVEFKLGRAETIGAEYRHTSYGSQSFDLSQVSVALPSATLAPIVARVGTSSNEIAVRVTVPLRTN